MKPQNLGIGSECFSDLREKFDYILNLALNKMRQMGIYEGKVTATVDIAVEKVEEEDREAWRPEFKCQVSVSLPLKGKIAASVPGGLKMVQDPNGEGYIIATEQYTFLDMLEDQGDGSGE